MERVNLFFLHGFLGRPSDWSGVQDLLARHERFRFYIPDYFNDPALCPRNSFEMWADNFNKWVERQGCAAEKNILIGYSLGGRLALHALQKNSALWKQVVLISTNPGFADSLEIVDQSSEERSKRWLNDCYWAEEFSKSSWEGVLRHWNLQPVFGRTQNEPVRFEKEYSRDLLSLALTQWSLAQQKNMRPVLRENVEKVRWLVGAYDDKFVELAQSLAYQINGLKVEEIPAASHRVLFDNPLILARRLAELIGQIS